MNILVTGGTGTFGQAFVRHALAQTEVAKVVVFSRDEWKQGAMRDVIPDRPGGDARLRFALGDVRDVDRLRHAFRGVNLVVHAAALKQVAAVGYNPLEAVRTNVTGTANVIQAALDAGVKTVVGLSSDKAVAPANLYGATKLCAEQLLAQATSWGVGTRFVALRYGNVLGSRGSVVERWRAALARREPLRGTDPYATRFVWTARQAATFAWDRATDITVPSGAVCVPWMQACLLHQLAEALAPGEPVTWSGRLGPGEKLHEALLSEHERWDKDEDGYVVTPGGAHQGGFGSPDVARYSIAELRMMLAEPLA